MPVGLPLNGMRRNDDSQRTKVGSQKTQVRSADSGRTKNQVVIVKGIKKLRIVLDVYKPVRIWF
jgi:hypothetical protein